MSRAIYLQLFLQLAHRPRHCDTHTRTRTIVQPHTAMLAIASPLLPSDLRRPIGAGDWSALPPDRDITFNTLYDCLARASIAT